MEMPCFRFVKTEEKGKSSMFQLEEVGAVVKKAQRMHRAVAVNHQRTNLMMKRKFVFVFGPIEVHRLGLPVGNQCQHD